MRFYQAIVVLLLLANIAQAHVPLFPEGNENISSAMPISDPGKSWAIYSTIGPEKPQYYSFYVDEGKEIQLALLKTANPREKGFEPGMALFGPGLNSTGPLPGYVEIPRGYGAIAVKINGSDQAAYEPFGPSSYCQLSDFNMTAPKSGTYYVAVYSDGSSAGNASSNMSSMSGHYSLAIGYREEFTFAERILTPLRLISVYQWEGQSLFIILMPMLLAFLIGLLTIWRSNISTLFYRTGTLAGFLILGTSATVLSQMAFSLTRAPAGSEVAITVLLAIIPAVLGVLSLRLSRGEAGILQRVVIAVVGTIALLAGSGLIAGPLLAIAASMLPSRRENLRI
ncbi:MAG: hypothetical protein ACE14P_01480 [Methanotrichaceae archaeon]